MIDALLILAKYTFLKGFREFANIMKQRAQPRSIAIAKALSKRARAGSSFFQMILYRLLCSIALTDMAPRILYVPFGEVLTRMRGTIVLLESVMKCFG